MSLKLVYGQDLLIELKVVFDMESDLPRGIFIGVTFRLSTLDRRCSLSEPRMVLGGSDAAFCVYIYAALLHVQRTWRPCRMR